MVCYQQGLPRQVSCICTPVKGSALLVCKRGGILQNNIHYEEDLEQIADVLIKLEIEVKNEKKSV